MAPWLGVDRSDWTVGRERFYTGEHFTGKKLSQEPVNALSTRSTKPIGKRVNAGGCPRAVFLSELCLPCQRGLHRCARGPRRAVRALGCSRCSCENRQCSLNHSKTLARFLETVISEARCRPPPGASMFRVLAATNADVKCRGRRRAVPSRPSLRLNTIEIHLPPLRDRREAIDLLSHHFLHGYAQRYPKVFRFDTAAIRLFMSMPAGQRPRIGSRCGRGVLLSPRPSVRAADPRLAPHKLLVGTAKLG